VARLLYALALALLGAALVAVALLLVLPGVAAQRRWNALAAALPPETAVRPSAELAVGVPPDPFFATALCRFSLREGPLRVSARGRVAFWSAAVHAPDGRTLASVNGGMLGDRAPDFVVLTHGQMAGAAPGPFPLEVDGEEGLLALRVFIPDESWRPLGEAFLLSLSCQTQRREGAGDPRGLAGRS
jgi:uncharacterized membrane protein